MNRRIFIAHVLVLITCLCLGYAPASRGAENSVEQENDKYIVLIENENVLVILRADNQTVVRRKFNFTIINLEICPSYPFLSFVGLSEKSGSSVKSYFIYDLERDKLYDKNLHLDIFERRWSPRGEYTYVNNHTSIFLVPTKYLANYLESQLDESKIIEIKGHPLGYVWQVTWFGNNIVYGSGIGDMECWGFFNTAKKKNFFVSCCGIFKGKMTVGLCNKRTREPERILKILISKAEANELHEISKDFHEEVLKMTSK